MSVVRPSALGNVTSSGSASSALAAPAAASTSATAASRALTAPRGRPRAARDVSLPRASTLLARGGAVLAQSLAGHGRSGRELRRRRPAFLLLVPLGLRLLLLFGAALLTLGHDLPPSSLAPAPRWQGVDAW